MARFGALADLELDHLDLVFAGDAGELIGLEAAVAVAAAEIAGADLPDDVAPHLAVIGADAALAGIMREVSFLRAAIQRANRIGTERAEAHGRNVEHRGGIGPGAVRSTDGDAEFLASAGLR